MLDNNPIFQSISQWFKRTFQDPGAVTLFMTLVIGLLFLELFGKLLMPILVSIVLAYLLLSLVRRLEAWKFPHMAAVLTVYFLFLGLFVFALVVLIPALWKQAVNLLQESPKIFTMAQHWFANLTKSYPKLFSADQIQYGVELIKSESAKLGTAVFKYSLATIPGIITIILYFVLVPLLVFFFIKDYQVILDWLGQYMPKDRGIVQSVWAQVNTKLGAYVKGRVLEIIIVAVVSTVTFALLGLQYAILLGVLTGLSVIIPYVGAVVVTIPIMIIGLMQWGLTAPFAYLVIAYAIIIALDGNLLAPLLLSEAMNLHPVVIIIAVVVFGGIWGFWGVFFAVPLAALVQAVLEAWPKSVA